MDNELAVIRIEWGKYHANGESHYVTSECKRGEVLCGKTINDFPDMARWNPLPKSYDGTPTCEKCNELVALEVFGEIFRQMRVLNYRKYPIHAIWAENLIHELKKSVMWNSIVAHANGDGIKWADEELDSPLKRGES